ncbi:MAG: hypothetical protein M1823_004996 [Watsoniomyces obsoletus]|nr:MAG: hypothetical protein M1823_004996 [Watsoniomyces obsoletus]
MPHSEHSQDSPMQEGNSEEPTVDPMEHDAQEENTEPNGISEDVEMTIPSSPVPAVNNLTVDDDDLDGDENDDDWHDAANRVEEASSQPTRDPVPPPSKGPDEETMRAYYQRLLPFRYLFQWLNHSPSPTTDFQHREFAFTLQNDAYLRYQAFPTSDLLRKEVLRLNPSRFEIGPVYTTNPRDRKTLRKSSNFRPLSKELVFDIDLTDYDEIRTCCTKANICRRCWTFITMAIKVVDAALQDDFGFKHILWVYSGRRGAHAWICDKRAREMDDQKRRAIAGYLEVIKGGTQSGKKVNVKRPLHPHLSRSLDLLKDHFQSDILVEQDPWRDAERAERLLQLLPDKALIEALRKKWESCHDRSSVNKWADIDALAKTGASGTLDAKALLEAKQDIVLEYTYPRLDVEVSKHLNHLLKSPFVIHPGTGRVCVPIDRNKIEEFDPLSVPTVAELLGEIDTWDREHPQDESEMVAIKRVQDYEKTRLKPYVEHLKAFAQGLMKEEVAGKREREETSTDAMEF